MAIPLVSPKSREVMTRVFKKQLEVLASDVEEIKDLRATLSHQGFGLSETEEDCIAEALEALLASKRETIKDLNQAIQELGLPDPTK